MQVTPKKTNTIHYLPQEIKETKLTEVTYLPITREMLEQLFSNSATDKYITAISSAGSVLWSTEVAGTAYGVPAIDNEGYIYYNDTEKGSLVKLEPATGKAIASLHRY